MIQVTGIREIDAVFRKMPGQLTHKVMQNANADAARPMVDAAHLLAPVGKTGNLAESIGVDKPSVKRVKELGQINIGPRRGGKNKGYHAHLVEYTKTNRDGSKSTPHPFMRPAFDRTKETVLAGINNAIGKVLYSFMKRTIRKNA